MDSKRKQTPVSILAHLRRLPKRPLIILSAACALLIVLAFLFWPRQVSFSYQQRACIVQPIIAPTLATSVSDDFTLVPDRLVKLGNVTIAAGGLCVQPKKAPQAGEYRASLAFFGLPFLGKQMTVKVGTLPKASATPLDKPIPVSKNLRVPLSTADKVFSYRVVVNDKTAVCESSSSELSCDVPELALSQGTVYALRLERLFAGKRVATVLERQVTTLSATTVQDTSIKRDETVFAKPKTAEIRVDKPITTAQAMLVRTDGDKASVAVQAAVKDNLVTVTWPDDLARQASYQLTLTKVEATDGSSLVEPFVLPFKMSGGPKVKGISIGKARVPIGATATITFDQPVSEKQDLAKVVTVSGGAAVSGRKGNQLSISFAGVPKCGDVVIKITDDLQSNYDVSGATAWQYASRTVCHTVGSIGSSAGGRSISAYYFGNGPSTVVYTGAIHGDETSTRSLMLRWIDDLEANARSIPANKSVVVVPAINPDGVASGRRTNKNNVDLNRNFGTADWRKDITTVTNAPFPGGGGASPMSEPETRAIAGLVSRLRPQLVLSYHSIGGVVAANQSGISSARTGTYSSLSGYRNATGSTGSVFEYAVSGTADDYYAERLGVASILVELGSHSYHQFERNQKAMWAMLQ